MKHLMANLPSLAERVQQIRTGKAATAAVDNDRNLEKSQVCGTCRAAYARACSARRQCLPAQPVALGPGSQ